MPRKTHAHTITLLLAFVLVAGPSGSALANGVALLGDSWGVLIGSSIRSTLDAEGYAATPLVNGSVGGSTAEQWASGVYDPASYIAPGTDLVHLILGGNDLFAGDPLTIIGATIANTISVLDEIAATTSAPILFSGYDYIPVPPPGITPALANAFIDAYVNGVANAVIADVVLSTRVSVLNTHGLMQVHFGVPQNGIPAFDPSLPDPTLPGPTTAFADSIHLTTAGYDVLAQTLFDDFYASALPEPSSALLIAIGFALLGSRRARC